ncbi:hypothetical protein Tco_1268657 [Tanacetum coccineum]
MSLHDVSGSNVTRPDRLQIIGDKLQIEDRSTSDDVAAGSSSSTDPSHNIVEDFNFEAFLNQDEKSPISDKKYIEEMELKRHS